MAFDSEQLRTNIQAREDHMQTAMRLEYLLIITSGLVLIAGTFLLDYCLIRA